MRIFDKDNYGRYVKVNQYLKTEEEENSFYISENQYLKS